MKIFPILIISLILLPVLASASITTVGPVTITGPAKVAVGSTFNYTVDVEQIFTHYKLAFLLSGYNLTGASPISPQYLNGTFAPENFTVKAPSLQTTLFLFFQVVATLNGQVFYYNITRVVQVLNYTTLTAKIYNPTHFKMKDLNVSFYVNNKYVGSSIVNISSNSTQNITYQWLSGTLSPGIYNVEVKINNTLVQVISGAYEINIQSGNPYLIYVYIVIAIIVAIVIITVLLTAIYNRRNKPKWKK